MSHRDLHDELRAAVHDAKRVWHQKQIAEAIGTTEGTFSDFMRGRGLGPALTLRLRDWLIQEGYNQSKNVDVESDPKYTDPINTAADYLAGLVDSIRSARGLSTRTRYILLRDGLRVVGEVMWPDIERFLERGPESLRGDRPNME